MTCAIGLMLALWIVALGVTLWGSICTLKGLRASPPHLDAPFGLYPVSILKPLKGADNGIRENIETFFRLDYPVFELIFSVADPRDPAIPLVRELIERHPGIDARLIIGGVDAGPNPKVNNMIKSYDSARYDHVLISDSNVRVEPDYLRQVVGNLDNDVGVITAVVAGRDADTLGGKLEAMYLNTFYARWMFVTARLNQGCVVGKSMFFSRKTAARFGGIRALARYLAEDYMTGVAMRRLGLRVVVQSRPIHQHIGKYAVADFWARHIRWGRIRKSQAPLAFAFEPLMGVLSSAVLGAIACHQLFRIAPQHFALVHFGLWSLCDLLIARKLEGGLRLWMPLTWVLRELLSLPMWAHTALGNTVSWRGQKLALRSGGLLDFS